jgi:hypothetical protein
MTGPMDTLGERMRQLHDAGWVDQLSVDDRGLRCDGCGCWAGPEDVEVDEIAGTGARFRRRTGRTRRPTSPTS